MNKELVREYFPRYQKLWGVMRDRIKNHTPPIWLWPYNFHCNSHETHHLAAIVPKSERSRFASNMYAHVLLAQVLHHYFGRGSHVKDEDVLNAFPRVEGVLSSSGHHICPATMPSMLVYWSSDMVCSVYGYSEPRPDKEKWLWLNESEIFDAGVKVVSEEIDKKLNLLMGDDNYLIDFNEVRYQYITEHTNLKRTLQQGSFFGR